VVDKKKTGGGSNADLVTISCMEKAGLGDGEKPEGFSSGSEELSPTSEGTSENSPCPLLVDSDKESDDGSCDELTYPPSLPLVCINSDRDPRPPDTALEVFGVSV
jgi:hypothetical protein